MKCILHHTRSPSQFMMVYCITAMLALFYVASIQAEPWNQHNSPTLFANDLVTTLQGLPVSGEANNIPWAGSYWPVYKDSINDPWEGAGTKPPSQKYAEAFGYNAGEVMDQVSLHHGIDAHSHRRSCVNDNQCPDDVGVCSKRTGQATGYCIPKWFGGNYAAPSILLSEPKYEVLHNGVNFRINDIKALISSIYYRTVHRFTSLRCNTDEQSMRLDAYGRPTGFDSECRDTNPGTLHLLLTNYIGIRGASFVADRNWDDEVWNEPIRGYRIVHKNEISAKEANRLVGVLETRMAVEPASGTVAENAWFHLDPINVTSEQNISVLMTGTNDADLYVRFGSQPTDSHYDCRPYRNGSEETCQLTVSSGSQIYISVKGYAESSDFNINVNIDTIPENYQLNSEANSFYNIKMEVDYIAPSDSSIDGYLGDQIDIYTQTETYEYVLELKKDSDGDEKIIGGEYIGLSKRNHPDFLWLPISHRETTTAGGMIKRSEVMTIYSKSQTPGNDGDHDQIEVVNYNNTVTQHEVNHYGPYHVKVGKQFTATMTGSNDADLYARAGSPPTKTQYDCRPYKSGSNEECQILSNGVPVYVAVAGYAATSDYHLSIEYVATEGNTEPGDNPPAVIHLNRQDSVTKGGTKHYVIELPNGYSTIIQTFSLYDIDIYIQENRSASLSDYILRAFTSSGNERIIYTPSSDVTLYIMVYGYESAPKFVLKTSSSTNP